MQLGSSCLTEAERKRCFQQSLCLYCGGTGHFLAACPLRKERVMHTSYELSNQFCLNVVLSVNNSSVSLSALLDSGSAGNIVSSSLVSVLSLSVESLASPVSVKAVDGCLISNSPVIHITTPLHLSIQPQHLEYPGCELTIQSLTGRKPQYNHGHHNVIRPVFSPTPHLMSPP